MSADSSTGTGAEGGAGGLPFAQQLGPAVSPFGQFMGLEFTEVADDHLVAALDIQQHHQNPTGAIHGGVFVSLADNVATSMANRAHHALTGEGRFMVGIDLHASMIGNQNGGRIEFEARPVRVGRRVAFIRTVVTGDGGRLLAEVTTTHVPA